MSIELPVAIRPEGEPFKFLATLKWCTSNNFRWTSFRSLQDAVYLAYCLYVASREDEAIEVCRFLGQLPPTSSRKPALSVGAESRLWGCVQDALALQARLVRRQGLDAEALQCQERMRSVSLFEYRMTGKVLSVHENNVHYALDDATYHEARERDHRLAVMIELVVMIELGVSLDITVPSLNEKFETNMMRLQELICRLSKSS